MSNNWVDNLSDNDIKKYLSQNIKKEEVPYFTDQKVLNSIRNGEKETKKAFIFSFKIAFASFAFILCLTISLLYIKNVFYSTKMPVTVLLTTGKIEVIRNKEVFQISPGFIVKQNDVLKTYDNSFCEVQIGFKSKVLIENKSSIKFDKIIENGIDNNIKISLIDGKSLFHIEKLSKNSIYEVNADDIKINVLGTQFIVEKISKEVHVFVNKGKVKVKNKQIKKEVFLIKNDSIKYQDKKQEICQINPKDEEITYFNNIKINSLKNNSLIDVKSDYENNILQKNDQKLLKFKDNLKMLVEDNNYQVLSLADNKEIVTKINFEKDKEKVIVVQKDSTIKEEKQQEKIEQKPEEKQVLIYKYQNKLESTKSDIYGFVQKDNTIVAVTKTSLIAFSINNDILWENDFSNQNIYFNTIPQIVNDKIIIPSLNQKLLIVDLSTGKTLKTLNTDGIVSFGYKSLLIDKNLFIPLSNGFYKLNTATMTLNEFYNIKNPKEIAFLDNKLIFGSIVEKKLICTNLSGEVLWNKDFTENTFFNPIIFKNQIIYPFNKAIYQFSTNGELINKFDFENGIASNLTIYKDNLYFVSSDGKITQLNIKNAKFNTIYSLEKQSSIEYYLFKNMSIIDEKIYIGNLNGELAIYNLNTNEDQKIKISNSQITTTILYKGNYFYVGTKNGEIFKLKVNN